MNRTKEVLILALGCAAGTLFAITAYHPEDRASRSLGSAALAPALGPPDSEPRTLDSVRSVQAHAEAAQAADATPPPVAAPSGVPVAPAELEAWLKTLPIDLIRRVEWAQEETLSKKIEDRYPPVKKEDLERHASQLLSALAARSAAPDYWAGETTLTVAGRPLELRFFFNYYRGDGGWDKPFTWAQIDKPPSLCYMTTIHVRGEGVVDSTGQSNCASGFLFVRDQWMITQQWRVGAIEREYSALAFAFPPFETSGATFELLGAKDSKWSTAPGISWRRMEKDEFEREQAKLRGEETSPSQ